MRRHILGFCVVTNMILQLEVLGRTRQTDLRSAPGRTTSEELITSQRDSESMRCHACLEQDRGRGNEQQKGFSGKEWRWGGWSPSSHGEGPSPAAYFVSLSPLQVHSYCYTGAAVTSCSFKVEQGTQTLAFKSEGQTTRIQVKGPNLVQI